MPKENCFWPDRCSGREIARIYGIFVYMNRHTSLQASVWIKPALLLIVALIINIFSYFPEQVEHLYSVGFYPQLAALLRKLTSWIPISVGDILYAWLIVYLLVQAAKMGFHIYHRQFSGERWITWGIGLVRFFLTVYIVFKLAWGLNYNRLGIDYQLRLSRQAYNKEEVTALTDQLIDTLNRLRRQMPDTVLPQPAVDTIYRKAFRSYQALSLQYEYLNYRNRSVKASLYTPISDYLGFTGYYNPFTGEAQVRTDIPRILLPYVVCHEMAHQLGYASESEANFVGYLAASSSADIYFRYSVYLDLFSYAQGEEIKIYGKENDFSAFESIIHKNRARLDTLVKKDRKEIREFFNRRRNALSPAVSGIYDQYLKLNKQEQGINSYNEVIGWLIAYRKKSGGV